MKTYSKPPLSLNEQVFLWEKRGLCVRDNERERIKRYLQFISYYRLSPYTLPFQIPGSSDHQFKANTFFDDILDLYVFDRELRLLVMDPIERIEVAVRASLTNCMSVKYGPNWYEERDHFRSMEHHGFFIKKIRDQVAVERQRRKPADKNQTFLAHYVCKYENPDLPPCWMMVELLSIGDLKNLLDNIGLDADKKEIADTFSISYPLLRSWLHSIHHIRNICAHHGRLWNREPGIRPMIPKSPKIPWPRHSFLDQNLPVDPARRVYIIFVVLQSLMSVINPQSGWKRKLYKLMEKYPKVSKAHMGMPEDWHEDPFWNL